MVTEPSALNPCSEKSPVYLTRLRYAEHEHYCYTILWKPPMDSQPRLLVFPSFDLLSDSDACHSPSPSTFETRRSLVVVGIDLHLDDPSKDTTKLVPIGFHNRLVPSQTSVGRRSPWEFQLEPPRCGLDVTT